MSASIVDLLTHTRPDRRPRRERSGSAILFALVGLLLGTLSESVLAQYSDDASIYSTLTAEEVPADLEEPSADDLAPGLGLVKGERSPHGIQQYVHPTTGMLFVFVPGGTFSMGSNYGDIYNQRQVLASSQTAKVRPTYFDTEQPMKEIYVSPFFIGVHEVTVAQYKAFLEAEERGEVTPHEHPTTPADHDYTPFFWKADVPFWTDEQPIVGIEWLTAYNLSRWMGGRLPTEAEWEKAARGTDRRLFPWGNQFDPMRVNGKNSLNARTMPVGTYEGGASPYGCYDMAGNVFEFTLDAFEEKGYRFRRVKDSALLHRAPDSQRHVVRGGSWSDYGGFMCMLRTTARERVPKTFKYNPVPDPTQYLQYGMRVVLSPHQDLYPEGFLEGK